MRVAILGYGSQGRSSVEYFLSLGHEVTVCDKNPQLELPSQVLSKLGDDYLNDLNQYDLLMRAPSIHPREIVAVNGEGILSKVSSNTNEFFKACLSSNIIGVTGTKGKGTTSTLIAKMLEQDGKTVHLGGNIGTPPLDMLSGINPGDWVVLELANFQLIDLKFSPPLAVCVQVEPEHLDWHTDTEEYFRAKQQLFRWQKPENTAVYYAANENSKNIASVSPGRKIPFLAAPGATVENDEIVIDGQSICPVSEVGLLGKHNWQNICAALTIFWQVSQNAEAARQIITTTTGLPFRIEDRGEIKGVKFYNDSFATGPGATIAAIEAMQRPTVVILGGYERGLPLDNLSQCLIKNAALIRKAVLIGDSAQRLRQELEKAGFTNFIMDNSKDINAIVKNCFEQAQPGDAVLLSPAFASFDMFKNFEQRGIAFNDAVAALKDEV